MQNGVNYMRHLKNNPMLIILSHLSLLKRGKNDKDSSKLLQWGQKHIPQPAETLPEEECYWCLASERKKWGQNLKNLNTTLGKTNDEGKRGKVAQSGSFAWRKRFKEIFCCSSQHWSQGESQ